MRLISVVMLILLLATSLMAQDKNEYPQTGLEFGLPQNIGIDDFGPEQVNGYDFSWTRRRSETWGWRVGMTLGGSTIDSNIVTVGQEDGSIEFRNSDALIAVLKYQQIFKTEPHQGVSMVFGIGPVLSYSSSSTSQLREGDEITIRRNSTSRTSIGGGVAWDLGVEWRATELFSVSARYEWDLTYSKSDREDIYSIDGELISRRIIDEYRYGLQNSNEVDLLVTFWY